MKKMWLIFLSLAAFANAAYDSQVLTDAPVAWWQFGDNMSVAGAVARDKIGDMWPSSFYDGDVSLVEGGINGRCAWFNGNDGGIDIGTGLRRLLKGANGITVEAWIRCANLPYPDSSLRPIFCSRINDAQAGFEVLISYDAGTTNIRVGARSNVSDGYQLVLAPFDSEGQWCHLVCVSDLSNDQIRIYVDGLLIQSAAVNFASNIYLPGLVESQTDQIGRDCSVTKFFRGWIDEVAVYGRALGLQEIEEHYSHGEPDSPASLWVSQAFAVSEADDIFYGSPSLVKLDNGHLLASHDFFGDGVTEWKTAVSKSTDGGLTWNNPVEINHMFWASMFEYGGNIYLLGVYSPGGSIVISKSSDEGLTWSRPFSSSNGYLFAAGAGSTPPNYTTGSVPVLFHEGRVYRTFEDQDLNLGSKFKALVISADLDSDLLNASNWTMSNKVEYDVSDTPQQWGATLPVWLEGNVVVAPGGQMWVLERFNSYPTTGKAALLKLSNDGTTLSWDVNDPEGGFIDMPGGMHKFTVRHDPVTGLYLAIVNNNNTDSGAPNQRNTLSLIASDDLRHWDHVWTLIQDNSILSWDDSIAYAGFQYVEWQFDGDDIIYLSRTSYDGADSYHNANRITFHRLIDYVGVINSCGGRGYSPMDFNFDCVVDFEDFSKFATHWLE